MFIAATATVQAEPQKFWESTTSTSTIGEELEQCEGRQAGIFSLYDYAVLIGMLVISLGIGVFYGFFDKNASGSSADFLLGSGMSVFPVTLSLTTSFITAIELLGNPSEVFFNGTQFSLIGEWFIFLAFKEFLIIFFSLQ
jgi:sodium-coupled monocarboxylate transporter 8/12